ncbi:MAG: hypothetical protein Q9175_001320 [Cornicularia normoerica]
MFCLRAWVPLLFLPTNASPVFVVTFIILTYFLNRPCIYCSALLLILFISSCSWRDQCLFDMRSNWFETKHLASPLSSALSNATDWSASNADGLVGDDAFLVTAINETASALAGAALEEMKRRMAYKAEWTGIGLGWVRSFLGARQWRVPCVDVYLRL